MSGDQADPSDVRIDPSVRQISRLGSSIGARGWDDIGSLPPFSGLLQPDRPRQPGRPGQSRPTLSYLTLQSLVVEHVREHTERETRVETVERTGDETGESDDEPAPDAPESTTVREFIRRASTDDLQASGNDEVPSAAWDDGPDTPSLALPELPWTTDDVRQSTGRDRPSDAARAGVDLSTLDRGRRTGDAGPRADRPGGLDPGRSGDRSRADTHRRPGGDGSPTDPAGGDTGSQPRSAVDPTDPTRGERPDLVVVDRSPPGAGDGETAGGSRAPRGQSRELRGRPREPPSRGRTTGGSGPDRRGGRSGPAGASGGAGSGEGDASATAQTTPGGRGQDAPPRDLAAALNDVPQPTLDRFVDRISDELERHERIERERRGR